MLEHGGRYSLALGLGARKGSRPVGDVGEEGVAFIRAETQEKEWDGFALSVPCWKVGGRRLRFLGCNELGED